MKALVTAGLITVACGVVAADVRTETRARADAIRASTAAISQECQQYAGGDWNAWYARLSPFRMDLGSRIDPAMGRLDAFRADPTAVASPLLRVDTTPPIYELPSYGKYLLVSGDGDILKWARELPARRAFVEVSQWLRDKKIDLLVVPSPRMVEVYGDRLANGAPPEKIVAPQLRRLFVDLLEADVEVVDLLPIFLKARTDDPQPLYLVSDGHWSDRAQRLAAAEIGRRLKRYDIVKAALTRKPIFRSAPARVSFPGAIFDLLTGPERDQVKDAVGAMNVTRVTTSLGAPFEEPAASPILVIGDSFTHYFQLAIEKGTGIDALLSKEINIPVSNVSTAGGTVDPVKEFLRRPALLVGRRVVVWVFNNSLLSYGADGWQLPPLPRRP